MGDVVVFDGWCGGGGIGWGGGVVFDFWFCIVGGVVGVILGLCGCC